MQSAIAAGRVERRSSDIAIPDISAGDGGRDGEHDVAAHAEILGSEDPRRQM
jgi:hypothetical protein